MRFAKSITTTAAAVLLSLAGCSGQDAPTVTDPAAASQPVVVIDGEAAPGAPTSPARSVVNTTDLKLGSVVHIPRSDADPQMTVTVTAYKKLANYGDPVNAVHVRLCIIAGDAAGYSINYEPWSLLSDGGESQYTTVTDAGKAPSYPTWEPRIIKPGHCVAGWLNFDLVATTPESVQYDIGDFQASWKL
jgi:hypothetical protein